MQPNAPEDLSRTKETLYRFESGRILATLMRLLGDLDLAEEAREGELILLDQQDRLMWNRDQIAEGIALAESALRSRRFGAYTLQGAIAAVHAEAFLGCVYGVAPDHAALRSADSYSAISGRRT